MTNKENNQMIINYNINTLDDILNSGTGSLQNLINHSRKNFQAKVKTEITKTITFKQAKNSAMKAQKNCLVALHVWVVETYIHQNGGLLAGLSYNINLRIGGYRPEESAI